VLHLWTLVQVTGVFKAMAVRVGPNQRTLKSLYKVPNLMHSLSAVKQHWHPSESGSCDCFRLDVLTLKSRLVTMYFWYVVGRHILTVCI
jgi:hypothetical protein